MFNELELIEQTAIGLFQSLSYTHQNCYHEILGKSGTLGIETPSDVGRNRAPKESGLFI